MTDAVTSFVGPHLTAASMSEGVTDPADHVLAGARPHCRSYRCADDKWLAVAALEPRFFDALCRGLGLEHLAGSCGDPERDEIVTRAFTDAFLTDTRDAWFTRLRETTCVAPVLSLDELAQDSEVAVGATIEVSAFGRTARQPAGLPGFRQRRTAHPPIGPFAGQHTRDVLAEAGIATERVDQLLADGVVEAGDPVLPREERADA